MERINNDPGALDDAAAEIARLEARLAFLKTQDNSLSDRELRDLGTRRRAAAEILRPGAWLEDLAAAFPSPVVFTDLNGRVLASGGSAVSHIGSLPEGWLGNLARRCHEMGPLSTEIHGRHVTLANIVNPINPENPLIAFFWSDTGPREELEPRFRALAEAVPQLVWEAGPDGQVGYYNQRIADFGGAVQDPETGAWKWEPLLHPDDQTPTIAAWQQAVESGEPYEIEHRVRMADGHFRWHLSRAVPVRAANGSVKRWFGTATDIHAGREVRDALRAAKQRLDATLAATEVGLWQWDMTTGLVDCDRNLSRHFGFDPRITCFPIETFLDRIAEEDQVSLREHMRQTLADNVPYDAIFRVRWPDESLHWLHARGHVERNAAGQPDIFLGVTVDITAQKNAEEVMRRNELRLRLAQKAGNIGIWEWDSTGAAQGTTYWSDTMWEIYGCEPRPGMDPEELFRRSLHPEDREGFVQRSLAALQSGAESLHEEFRIVRPDGSQRWIQTIANILRNSDGVVTRMIGVNIDVTASKHDREALRQRAEELEQLMNVAPVAIWVSQDPLCQVITGNRMAHELFRTQAGANVAAGTTEGQALASQHRFFDRDGLPLSPEDLPMQKASRLNIDILNEEILVERDDGVSLTMLGSAVPLRDANSQVRGSLAAFVDISVRKTAEEALRERERELASLAENSPDILARFDRELRHVFVNGAAARAAGLSVGAFLGRSNREIGMDPGLCDLLETSLRRVFASGEPCELEFTYETPAGCRRFESRLVPEFGDDGSSVAYVLGVTHDVTARRLVQDELRRAKEAAERASRARDQFLAILSHELRTPLSPVLLTASAFARRADLPQEIRDAMVMIQRNIRVEARLIDDLLDLSRVLNSKLHLEKSHVELTPVLRHAMEICREDSEVKNLHFEVALEAESDQVSGDAARLQQVLWNLLKNAIKFTAPGGWIRLRTTSQEGTLSISISDSGVGIAPEALPKLFRPFEQAGEHITKTFGGLGLGLAICKGIVDLHGGRIEAFSEGPGLGAEFTIHLPLAGSFGQTASAPDGVLANVPEKRLNLLLVEDHVDTAAAVAQWLRAREFDVSVAHSGNHALALATERSFDLLISDLGLPDIDGISLLGQIQSIQPLRAIAMSGFGTEADLEATRRAGFAAHLVKPVDGHSLEETIRRVHSPE